MEVSVIDRISRVSAEEWDALVGDDNPFIEHAFLDILEESGSVSAETGWQPAHVLVRDEGRLIGAAPLYVKDHSYGEYIFDWGWAQAANRAGLPYYPKLVDAVPFTPATGRRLLTQSDPENPDAPEPNVTRALVAGFQAVAEAAQAWSIHLLFTTAAERTLLAEAHDFIPRTTQQYHWHNKGYESFDHWLSFFRSKDRKNTRRERRKALEEVDHIRVVPGSEVTDREWRVIRRFYLDTISKKWGQAYLTDDFFSMLGKRLGDRAKIFFAEKDNRIVASALTFHKGKHLYGRYWGGRPGLDCLHFELCYHRPIQECIENGWTLFEAGAQGSHKLKRGLMPVEIASAHWLRHPGLKDAVADAMRREARYVRQQIAEEATHGPFRREAP
ncbi:MAG: GNAT family N-acetyltransferase [Myxococcota bacterium]